MVGVKRALSNCFFSLGKPIIGFGHPAILNSGNLVVHDQRDPSTLFGASTELCRMRKMVGPGTHDTLPLAVDKYRSGRGTYTQLGNSSFGNGEKGGPVPRQG
jgi:hypothetical protein